MTTRSNRIRAMHAEDKTIPRAEIARRVGASRALVSKILGPTKHSPKPLIVPPMDGAELAACLRKAGASHSWIARWLGMRPGQLKARMGGMVAVQPAEAALFRLLASGEVELDRIVRLSATSA
jgi:hypothetical protein